MNPTPEEEAESVQTEPAPSPYRDPEYLALVPALRAAGDDLTPFLVAADWLQERGAAYGSEWKCEEHAAVVRRMCEDSRDGCGRPVELSLAKRISEVWRQYRNPSLDPRGVQILLGRNANLWFGDIPEVIERGRTTPPPRVDRHDFTIRHVVWIRNGFVTSIESHAHYLCAHLDSICKRHPVSAVSVLEWSHEDAERSGVPLIWRRKEGGTGAARCYRVFGKDVRVEEGDLVAKFGDADHLDRAREKERAKFFLERRFPGVSFSVNI